MAGNSSYTLSQLRNKKGAPDITHKDLVYMVDESVSKAATIEELIAYFSKHIKFSDDLGNVYIVAKQSEEGPNPTLRYNNTSHKWQYSNDGISYYDIGTGGGGGGTGSIASEDTLGGVKVGSGLSIADDGTLSVDMDKVLPDNIEFTYAQLTRSTFTQDEVSMVRYSVVIPELRLFNIYEIYDGSKSLVYPTSMIKDELSKTIEIIWEFTLEEDTDVDFKFKQCSWIVDFGK